MNAARNFLNRLGLFTGASPDVQEGGPEYWREHIYDYMLSTMVLVGLLAVIPSVWLSFAEGLYGLGIFDIAAYGFVVGLLYLRRIRYRIRATLFLYLGLAVGVSVFFLTGHGGAGLFWLFVAPPLASLLLGLRTGGLFYAINILIFVVLGFVVASESTLFPHLVAFTLESWVVYGINFLITNALVTLPLGLLLNGLFNSTQEAQSRLARIRSLYSIDQAIIGSLDLDKTLSGVMRETRSQLGVDAVAIWLSNDQGWLDYSYGLGFEEVGHGQGKIKDQAGAIAPQSLDWLHMDKVFNTKFGTPLLAKGKMIGLLEVYEKSATQRNRDWFEMLLAIAGQSSIAIQNARLFEDASAARLSAERDADFFRLLFYNHPVPMWIYDLDSLVFLEVNEAAVENYGFTREEFLHMTIKEIRPPEDVGKLLVDVAQERPRLQHSEGWRHRLKDGKVIDVEIVSHTLVYKGRNAALVMAQDISQRKQAQEKLRLSDDILQRVKSIVLVINAEGKIIYASPGAEEIIGYPPEDLLGDGWWRLSRAKNADAEAEMASLRRIAKGELPLSDEPYENPIQTKSGETRWIEWLDALGPNNTVIGVGRDITERKQNEEKLRLSDQILQNVKSLVIVLDSDQRVIYASPSVEEVTGYSPDEIMGEGWWQLSRRDQAEAQKEKESVRRAMLGQAPFSNEPYERRIQDRSGETHWIEWQDVLGPDNTLIGVGHEITERKKMEIEIREGEERTRLIIDNSLDAIITMDRKGLITGWNPQAKKTLGWTHQEAVGQLMKNLIVPPQYREAHQLGLDLFLKTGEGSFLNKRIELSALHRDGHEIPVELAISPVKAGNEVSFSAFIRDVGERKSAEAQIQRQLEHMRSLSEIDRLILSSFDLKLNLQALVKNVINQLRVDAANIMIYNSPMQTLHSMIGSGFRTNAFEGREIRLGEGFAGLAAQERKVIRILRLDQEEINPRLARAMAGEDFIAYFGVPLIAKGEVRGVLEIFQRNPLDPDEEWLELLNTLAGRAALTIDAVKVFENLQKSNADLTLSYNAAIEGWSTALDLRDKETEGHSQRVTELAVKLAERMGVKQNELVHFRRGALLHDIGKMGIPDSILLKPDKLNDQEWEVMKQHPLYARNMLRSIAYLQQAIEIPLSHHEKWDGSGYPDGLAGEAIPLAARIFAVIDVYDALTSDRPYRKAWTKQKTIQYIKEQSGKHFDPQVVEEFLKLKLP